MAHVAGDSQNDSKDRGHMISAGRTSLQVDTVHHSLIPAPIGTFRAPRYETGTPRYRRSNPSSLTITWAYRHQYYKPLHQARRVCYANVEFKQKRKQQQQREAVLKIHLSGQRLMPCCRERSQQPEKLPWPSLHCLERLSITWPAQKERSLEFWSSNARAASMFLMLQCWLAHVSI